MPTPLDLREFAAALPAQNLSPRSLKTSVCNNITAAVASLAKASPTLNFTIDRPSLERVVGSYLQENPTHNNPFNFRARTEGNSHRVDYYNLDYQIDKSEQGRFENIPHCGIWVADPFEPQWLWDREQLKSRCLLDGKKTYPCGQVSEGKWQHIEQLNNVHLVDGKISLPDGQFSEGKWRYVEQLNSVYLVDGKITFPSGQVHEGKRQYVEQLNNVYLVDGKITFPSGCVEEGKWQYIEQKKRMCLVDGIRTMPNGDSYSGTFAHVPGAPKDTQLIDGTLTYSNGRSETGEFAYIPQLSAMKLVNGTTTNPEGEVLKQGRREYVPQKNGMMLIEGLSVFPDGTRQEGTRSYVPQLDEVVLTQGTITRGSTVQTGTWAYSQFEGKMVFKPTPPTPKLPLHVRHQIQNAADELVRMQHRFDATGKFSASAALLNTAAEQAQLAQNPEQYHEALQSLNAQYKTLTRELSLLTHPDKVADYSASVHGAALQRLVGMREDIDRQVEAWKLAETTW